MALSRIIDRKVLEGDSSDHRRGAHTRERLFDVPEMRRLDAMTPYKDALRRISYALRGDPASPLVALNGVAAELATASCWLRPGINTEGPLGRLKLQGVVIAFAPHRRGVARR